MSGHEIWQKIQTLHKDYMKPENDNLTQPELALTTQQLYKLADHVGYYSRHYHNVMALAEGTILDYTFESVKLKRRR